jgi:hypothetical protein
MNEEFYIGWEDQPAPIVRRRQRTVAIVLLLAAALTAVALAVSQQTIGVGVFEFGTIKKFAGVLEMAPYPHLLVPRPDKTGGSQSYSTYFLVAPFKHGLDPQRFSALDGQYISLMGTLIYRQDQTMIEALPDSIKAVPQSSPMLLDTNFVPLGRETFTGEIVDSKCYFGVMNPGQLLPHRGCAICCIRGGIPPVLLVRTGNGPPLYLMLVSSEGKPVNQQVLDLVAEPVQITGEVEKQGDLLILRADPATYTRVSGPANQ